MALLLTSDPCSRDVFSPRMCVELSRTIFTFFFIPFPLQPYLIIFRLVNVLGLGYRPNSYNLNGTS